MSKETEDEKDGMDLLHEATISLVNNSKKNTSFEKSIPDIFLLFV